MTDYIKREDAVRRIAVLIAAEAESDGYEDQPMENYIEYASEDLADIPSADVAPVRHGRWIIECASEDLADIPSADVAPVRHGRWIYEGNELVCSRCGGSVSFSRNNDGLALSGKAWALGIYCQTCGAKMDEGGNGWNLR